MSRDIFAKLLARLDAEDKRPLLQIDGSLPIEQRWQRLRANYATFQAMVDAGLDSWMGSDPYQIADWVTLFTPIETAVWSDIRGACLPLWPQLPVGRFFLDFGNPVAKVAIECDGRRWHSPEKDAKRDTWLRTQGWEIFRAPGWRCVANTELPACYDEASEEERAEMNRTRNENTMVGIIRSLKAHFRQDAN